MSGLNNPVAPCTPSDRHCHGDFLHLYLMGFASVRQKGKRLFRLILLALNIFFEGSLEMKHGTISLSTPQETSFWGGWVRFSAVKGSYWVMEILYILIELWITWVHAFVKTYPIVHLMDKKNLCILPHANYTLIKKKLGVPSHFVAWKDQLKATFHHGQSPHPALHSCLLPSNLAASKACTHTCAHKHTCTASPTDANLNIVCRTRGKLGAVWNEGKLKTPSFALCIGTD